MMLLRFPHLGVNAIDIAAQLIAFLQSLAAEGAVPSRAMDGVMPPFTTINVGTINGGQQFNIVPAECMFEWEIRSVPGDDVDDLLARFRDYSDSLIEELAKSFPGISITTTVTSASVPFHPEDDSPAETLVKSLAGTNEAVAIAFGTEAPCYQQAGMSVVVFGPGSIAQAHKPDEYLALDQVDACVDFMRRLMSRLSSPAQARL